LTSQCSRPAACSARNPSTSPAAAASNRSLDTPRIAVTKSSPSISSITSNQSSPDATSSCCTIRLGWTSAATVRNSFLNRRRVSPDPRLSRLTATGPSRASWAANTVP
jgi:hypothetical protein